MFSRIALVKMIEETELRIALWSERDPQVIQELKLDAKLADLKMQLAEVMSNENDIWLMSHSMVG